MGRGRANWCCYLLVTVVLVLAVPTHGAMALKLPTDHITDGTIDLEDPSHGAMALKLIYLVDQHPLDIDLAVPSHGAMALKLPRAASVPRIRRLAVPSHGAMALKPTTEHATRPHSPACIPLP